MSNSTKAPGTDFPTGAFLCLEYGDNREVTMFDWIGFFEDHGIEYVTRGPNVGRNHVTIHCPFCGTDDPSHHMSVSLVGNGWKCWRNQAQHKGKSPVKLIVALIGCSYQHAEHLAGGTPSLSGDLVAQVKNQIDPSSQHPAKKQRLVLPKEFKAFGSKPSARPFISYMVNERGFTTKQVLTMSDDFDVRYCRLGSYRYRIIFPIYFENRLVSWTGRSISGTEERRYKVLSSDPETAAKDGYPPAIGPNTDYLLWYDDLMDSGADTIHVVEGPLDALKINVLGAEYGICATCLFTTNMTDAQVDLLYELLPRFERRLLTLDQGTLPMALGITSRLPGTGIQLGHLPKSYDDPGELDLKGLLKI